MIAHGGSDMSVVSSHRVGFWRRRSALQLFASAGISLPFLGAAARADEGTNTTKGGAWLLGDNLSLAALLYNQGAASDMTDRFLSKAKKIADIFGVEIKPFPAKAATSAEASADIIHYLIAGDGADVGVALARKYDQEHGILFEVAVKSNLLILLYGPGDSLGKSIAQVIQSRLGSINLPDRLWSNVVTLVNKGASEDEVKEAVFKMHKDIADFYIPGSG
jgi:hypothetical protein